MLIKLMKHEFRATARIMGPLYLVLLVTALGANFSARGILSTQYRFLDFLGALLVLAFVAAIIGVCVICFFLMIQRFYKNLLGDEGYLMFTLPASVHQHVWSKLIVSSAWFILTGVAVILSFVVVGFNISFLTEFVDVMVRLFQQLTAYYALNGTAILLELLLLAFVGCVAFCLQFYAALAVGHGFSSHKMLLSVVFFFAFQFAIQIVSFFLILLLDESPLYQILMQLDFHISRMAAIHIGIWLMIVVSAIYGAVFYAVTTIALKKRLNLE